MTTTKTVREGQPKDVGKTVEINEKGYCTTRYVGQKNEYTHQLTNFKLNPKAVIRVKGSEPRTLVQVQRTGADYEQLDLANDCDTPAHFNRWCLERGLLLNDCRGYELTGLIRHLLEADLPELEGVEVIGLHGDTFVTPNEVIGDSGHYIYVPPAAGSSFWDQATRLGQSNHWFELGRALELVAQLNSPEIMTPLLGYVAACPVRSLCREFPIFAMLGSHGAGKTATVATVLDVFGFWTAPEPINLTSTSAYAIAAFCGSSNALPCWIDEWRPSTGREDARLVFQQILRDAWNGATSLKGGGGANRMKLVATTACAPLIVTGEGQLTEGSHLERAVIVQMPKNGGPGRNVEALRELHASDEDSGYPMHPPFGLGWAYLNFLLHDVIERGIRPPYASATAGDRPAHALAVVKWGYEMLTWFASDFGFALPDLDLSKVTADAQEASQDPLIVRLLATVLNDPGAGPGIVVNHKDGNTYVYAEGLANYIGKNNKDPDMVVPGGSATLRRMLKDDLHAVSCDGKGVGIRCAWRFPTPEVLK